jgi:phosphoenolpyruvate synthase/pyruvate phosphate dikinase
LDDQLVKHNPIHGYGRLTRQNTEEGRKYLLPDGSHVSSVTTILDRTKDKTHLIEWRKRIGVAKATAITTEASGRGTSMHKQIENWLEHDNLRTGGNLVHQTAGKMAQKIIDEYLKPNVEEWWGSEVSLYYDGLYAGTTDLVGLWRGTPTIMDFKQTNKPKKDEWIEDYRLQLAAYAHAHNHMFGTDIRQGVIMMCSPDLQPQMWTIAFGEFDRASEAWWQRVEQFYSVRNS